MSDITSRGPSSEPTASDEYSAVPAVPDLAARRALAAITVLVEPADAAMVRLLDRIGPEPALEVIRSDRVPEPPGDPDGALTAAVRHALPRWRVRLAALDEAGPPAVDGRFGRLVGPGDPEWPTQLTDLGDARPYGLWVRGPADLRFNCLRSVSVVGSRAATPYGEHVAAEFGYELAERGFCVVSGGAYGIDTRAHHGALGAGGCTISVLACGADIPHPRGNAELFRRIVADGLLVSEWPPGSIPTRQRFLVRNRVIAAMTRGTVVVEAALRSGALNTARHARDQGRAVLAVPGPVTSTMSAGCHWMLREWNATCATNADEVAEQVGGIGDDLAPPRRGPVLARDALDEVTCRVLDAVPVRGAARSPVEIAAAAGVDLDATMRRLGALAAGGFVTRHGRGWRTRTVGR